MRAASPVQSSAAIDRPLPLFGGDQVEYWRLMFAEMLACQPSTAKLALSYLALCPTYGADAAETLLESMPLGDDSPAGPGQVHRLLHICDAHGLASSAAAICRSAAAAAWYGGRPGEAAAWALRARDGQRLAVAMKPAVAELASLLQAGVGNYQVSLLPMESAEGLEALLDSLSSSSQQQQQPGASTQFKAASECSSVLLLRGFLELQRAVGHLASLSVGYPMGSYGWCHL